MPGKSHERLLTAAFLLTALTIIYLLSSKAAAADIDLQLNGQDIKLLGPQVNAYTGHAIAFGDVNGDGKDDLIVAAPGYDYHGRSNCGIVYIILASDTLPAVLDLSLDHPSIKRIIGPASTQSIGSTLATGNVNGDGNADIIWGQSGASPNGRLFAGEVFVVFGSSSPPDTLDLASQSAGASIVLGTNMYDKVGSSVAVGDVDNDGFDDIFAGAPLASPPSGSSAGEVFVLFGSASFPSEIDLTAAASGITCIMGEHAADTFGNSCFGADFDKDGYCDLMVGAPMASPLGRSTAGTAYVIWGNTSFPETLAVASIPTGLTRIFGAATGSLTGASTSAADLNGNSFPEAMISAIDMSFTGKSKAGGVYLLQGLSSMPDTIDLTDPPLGSCIISGPAANAHIGMALAAGDLNYDGLNDAVIAAPEFSPAGRTGAGQLFIIFGRNEFPGAIDLSDPQTGLTRILGAVSGDYAGGAVATGDFNGDAFTDLVLGSRNAKASGRSYAGISYLILGNPAITPTQLVSYHVQYDKNGVSIVWELFEPATPNSFAIARAQNGGPSRIIALSLVEISPGKYMFADKDVIPDTYYTYIVSSTSDNRILFTATVFIPQSLPLALYQNFPNPFSSSTLIPFSLPGAGRTSLRIYDARGALVAELPTDALGMGEHEVAWDGRNRQGHPVSSGVYFVHLDYQGKSRQRKLLLIR